MTLTEDPAPSRTPIVQTSVAAAALALCVALVVWLGLLVLREIDSFSTANSDNLQWSLSQAEVEFLQFRLAISDSEISNDSLPELRRRFDIFYSRMSTMRSGKLYNSLRETDEYIAPGERVQGFMDRTIPLIDGPSEDLIAALPELRQEATRVAEDVRAFSLAALIAFAEVSDSRRDGITRLMVYMALVLMVMFVGLTLLAFTMYRLFQLAKRRADEVQVAGARMRTVVETSPSAIIVTDSAGVIREFNPAAERIFGYTRAEARGRFAREMLVPPEDVTQLNKSVMAFIEEGRRPRPNERHFELVAQARDGRRFPAEMSVDRAEAENPLYVSHIRDISKRKEAEAQLTEARDRALAGERAKSEFLAVMSHEMRTPLNGLLGSAQLMRDHSLTARQTELLDRMQSSGKQLLDLVNDVLDLAKFEAGKMEAITAPFSVAKLLDGVIETAQPLALTYGNSLTWRWIGPENGTVLGDARRLRQVLLNLVGNALKFTRDGSVEVELEYVDKEQTELEFRVIDSGIGITEEDLARIFNDFETLDSSYAREAGGTGLGLGIARRFARLMGGEIGAESVPDEGSLFWLRLPLPAVETDEDEAEDDTVQHSNDELPPLDVLLVEDNEINRFILREMLKAEGHWIAEAENGEAGVNAALRHRYDIILMDISMPVMDGTEATTRIRASGGVSAKTPIIALTAHALPEERERFRKVGMDACLTKPIDRQLLLRTIAEIVGGEPKVEADCTSDAPAKVSLVDEATLDAFINSMPAEMTERLTSRFFAEMDRDIAILCCSDPEDAALVPLVHKCAGSCGTFGATVLRSALADIEGRAKQGITPEGRDLGALSELWAKSRAELEQRLQPIAASGRSV